MKKLITLIFVVSMLVTVFASCEPSDEISCANSLENSVTSETETSASDVSDSTSKTETSDPDVSDTASESEYIFVPHEEYVPNKPTGPLCYGSEECIGDGKHPCGFFDAYPFYRESFFNINAERFCDFFNISEESWSKNAVLYRFTQADNWGFLLEYFQISKDEYISFLNEIIDETNVEEVDKDYPLLRYVNGWYSENYMEDENMIYTDYKSKGETYYAEKRDGKHNSIYYTIDYRLINYVGNDKFEEYLDKTDDVNILSFIDYFDIDAYTFSGIIATDSGSARPYSAYYVFGSDDEREAYFGFASTEIDVDSTLFVPFGSPFDDLYSPNADGVHAPRYFVISEKLFSKVLGKEVKFTNSFIDTNDFARKHFLTENWNYGFLIEYYGITEEQWRDWVDELYPVENRGYKNLEWQYDLWFRSRYEESLLTISLRYNFPEVRTYYGERIDETYNSIYYKIDRKLILKVGVDKFEKFLEKYEGTKDCNVMKFIKEFNLTKDDLAEIYNRSAEENEFRQIMPYNVKMMFDDPDAYFKTAK